MLYSVLAVGDVVGEAGLAHLERHLRPLQKLKNISFTVVNGENISGVGLTCKQAWRVYDAGADAVTLGNHTFGKMEIGRMLDETPWLLRPANLSGRMPGHGCEIFDLNGLRFRVVNLIGRCTLQWNAENPFTLADQLLKQGTADFTLVDFHAEATSEKLALGYYLVQSDLGALCSLDTTMPNVTIKEKNSESTVDIQVQEDSTGDYGDHNDADIGQTVNFKTTINVVDGEPKNYVLHDTMSAGLTFDPASVAVTIGERTLAKNTDYTLVTSGLTDGCTFEVQFKDGVLKPNDVVEVAYSAEVNEYAVIGGAGNDNKTQLKYGEDKGTEWDETHTYVWQFDVFKYAMRDGKEIPLAGAQFVLYKTVNDEKFYAQVANGKITGWTDDKEKATVFETPDNGKFVIAGLDADTYYLEEIKAPDGYNQLKDPVKVVITATIAGDKTGRATITYNETATGTVRIENQTGVELPSTGGIGTTVFYVIGGLLMGVAVVLLVTRKKMATSK